MFAASKTSKANGTTPAATDPQFNYVTMLLHGDGTNGAQNNTFVDSSTNNFTITRNGTPTQGSFSPYGDLWSNYFGGSQFLTAPSNAAFGFGTSNYTVEFYLRIASVSTYYTVFDNRAGGEGIGIYITPNAALSIFSFNTPMATSANNSIALNSWVHVAIVKNGTTITGYINGVSSCAATDFRTYASASTAVIASDRDGASFQFVGYLSNFRVVKGTAVYTSNFTPSTTPLTAVSGTSLLTCQSNRFKDNSSNNFAITVTGTPSVQRFSPFDPAAEYSTSVIGGSGYFGGSQFLTAPSNAAFGFGTGDFTIEALAYFAGVSTQQNFIDLRSIAGSTAPILYITATGVVNYSVGGAALISSSSNAVAANTWNHIALTRSSGGSKIFVNGVQVGLTAADSTNFGTTIAAIGGGFNGTNTMTGYLSNVRIVKGTAVYTANFTPPTAPLTAITNTSLLLNCVNAGIYDNAMMNDLVTVGDAQVSTAVVKYGTGSIKFDGTGDWLTFVDSPNVQLGTGNFTIEGWVNLSLLGSSRGIFSKGTSTTGLSLAVNALNQVVFNYTASSLTGTTVLMATTWYHIAVVRSGSATGNVKIYINGTADATSGGAITDNFNQTNAGYIGADRTGTSPMNGYIDDLRITKGVARYTANFTPPTAPFPNN